MTDFDDDERSAARSRPVDLYSIQTPTALYRLTSHPVDVTYLGTTFAAETMSRGNLTSAQDLTGRELILYLPVTHDLVRRYAATGIPEQSVRVTMLRLQSASGQALQQWAGFAGAMTIQGGGGGGGGHVAMLRVPSLTDDAFKVRLPVIGAQPLCNHKLYDSLCTVDRASAIAGGPFVITAIASDSLFGSLVTTTSSAGGTQYTFGEIRHLATDQRRMVRFQSASVLTLDAPFVGANVGDFVEIAPGCDHTVPTCRDKFSNVVNFGAHPDLNSTINYWAPNGLGVVRQP